MQRGVLLVNLGSPDAPTTGAVRRYLAEFLDDPRVLDLPMPLRRVVLWGVILPFRPRKSAEAYQQIWTESGSPLIEITHDQARGVRDLLDVPVAVAMRYGRPSIAQGLEALRRERVEHVRVVPLYPHYAMSSYETVVARVREEAARLGDPPRLSFQPPFYDEPGYIEALSQVLRPHLEQPFDHVLFSYHGIPARHVEKTDPSRSYCLRFDDCCAMEHPAQAFCYRHQVFATTRAVTSALGLSDDQWSLSFQSRLGPGWLQPFTDVVLEELPKKGVKRLVILSPSFVADCLETLEELGIRGRELFVGAGGAEFRLVPCLNDDARWIEALAGYAAAPATPALPLDA